MSSRIKGVLAGVAVMAAMGAVVPAANAAKVQTANGLTLGGTLAANSVTFTNAGSAAGSHTFTANGVAITCTTVSYTHTTTIANGSRAVTVQPTYSGCNFGGGLAAVTVRCGTWTFSTPAPPPETHNATTGATTGISVTLNQLSSLPSGRSCRVAFSSCQLDIQAQTVSNGITGNNTNATDTADVGDTSSPNGLRINSTSNGITYNASGCAFVGIPNGAGTGATYSGKARFASSTAARVWILPG